MLSRSAACLYPTLLLPAQREGFSAPALEIIGSSIGHRLWKRDPACDIVNLTTRRRPGLAWGHRVRARCHQLLPHLADLAHLPQRHVQRAFAQHRAATQLGHCFWGLSTAATAASPSQGGVPSISLALACAGAKGSVVSARLSTLQLGATLTGWSLAFLVLLKN
jgi:hypothetical protein